MRISPDRAVKAKSTGSNSSISVVPRTKRRVSASVGPYGAVLADGSEYHGRYALDEEGLRRFHRDRLEILL